MNMPKGVYKAYKKDSTEYYRVSITFKNKHVSLGSFDDLQIAANAYSEAHTILNESSGGIVDIKNYTTDYDVHSILSFEKWIILINFRDNGLYFKTPIYMCHKYFLYFLTNETVLKFDVDDLFYYSTHKIMARNGYLFVNDYGMQTGILNRYGIRNFSVCGKDYYFSNKDSTDYRYGNIIIVNKYFGVREFIKNGRNLYKVKIHINGDYVIGTYVSEKEAAIAYNKTIDILRSKKISKNYTTNYIDNISNIEYASIYNRVKISKRIREYNV